MIKSVVDNSLGKKRWPLFEGLLGKSQSMREICFMIEKVAPKDVTILITGESGTGKELVARAIHRLSKRSEEPFIVVNCAAMTASLWESEFFGHEKGSFTGAYTRQQGKLEQAQGGTLFLDEIGEMDLSLQAKLLRAVEGYEFNRVGGHESIPVNTRFIFATNKDLAKEVKNGGFRPDLFYRLNTVTIALPPLREREEDIPLLANYFLEKYRYLSNSQVEVISHEVMEIFCRYSWPGNVRELQNEIERICSLDAGKIILPEHLRPDIRGNQSTEEVNRRNSFNGLCRLEEIEKDHIVRILEASEGNISQAARILGISRPRLYRKIRQFHIEVKSFKKKLP